MVLSKGFAAETRVPSSDLQHLVKGGCSALGGLPGSLEAAVTSLSVSSQWALGYLRYDFGVSTEFLLSLHAHIKRHSVWCGKEAHKKVLNNALLA